MSKVIIEIDGVKKTEAEWRTLHRELDRLFGKAQPALLPALDRAWPTTGPVHVGPSYVPPSIGDPAKWSHPVTCSAEAH